MSNEKSKKLFERLLIPENIHDYLVDDTEPMSKRVEVLISRTRNKDAELGQTLFDFLSYVFGSVWHKPDVRPDGKRKFLAKDRSGSVYVCMYDKHFDRLVYDDQPSAHRTWDTCGFEKWAYLDDVV